MPTEQNKISVRQIFAAFLLTVLSPAIRLFPQLCSEIGGLAGWTAPIFGAAGLVVLYHILSSFFKNTPASDLCDVMEMTLGKIGGKILISIFLIWILMLFFLYIRYYAERLLSSIFTDANIRFFLITMLPIVYVAARGKIESFFRFCEISFLLFILVFLLFYVLLIPTVKIGYLLPLTTFDLWPAVKSAYPVLSIFGYLTYFFFMGQSVLKKDDLVHQGRRFSTLLVVTTTLLMIFTVGSLGPEICERMPLPFFNAIKLSSLIPDFDRFEAMLLSIWVVADFIIITSFAMILMKIVRRLFDVSEDKYFASPLMLMGYVGSMFLATDRFELERFSLYIALPINIVTCFFVPFVLLIVGKLRRKI